MTRVRKRPVEVEAVQWTGDNIDEILDLVPTRDDGGFNLPHPDPWAAKPGITHVPSRGTLEIPTLEGTMTASVGDWIIRGVHGEMYPCKDGIFQTTYEPVDPAETQPTPAHNPTETETP